MRTYLERLLWSELPAEVAASASYFTALFFLLIASFWFVGSLQEPVLYHCAGVGSHAAANLAAILFLVPLLVVYAAALRRYPPFTVFRAINRFYALFFALTAFFFLSPAAFDVLTLVGITPHCASVAWGWLFFIAVKTYGSLIITLFWSCATTAHAVTEGARIFPVILILGQLGSLSGASCARLVPIIGVAGALFAVVALLLIIDQCFFTPGRAPVVPLLKPREVPPFRDVLSLCFHDRAARALVGMSLISVVVAAAVDFYLQYLGHAAYPDIGAFTAFKGYYGQLVNGVTLTISLVIGRVLQKQGSVEFLLVSYPVIVGVAVLSFWAVPTLTSALSVTIIVRSLGFGLYNPLKEVLYAGSDSTMRFTVKGWVDILGYRLAWVAGSQIALWAPLVSDGVAWNNFIAGSALLFLPCLVLWMFCAIDAARVYRRRSSEV